MSSDEVMLTYETLKKYLSEALKEFRENGTLPNKIEFEPEGKVLVKFDIEPDEDDCWDYHLMRDKNGNSLQIWEYRNNRNYDPDCDDLGSDSFEPYWNIEVDDSPEFLAKRMMMDLGYLEVGKEYTDSDGNKLYILEKGNNPIYGIYRYRNKEYRIIKRTGNFI